MIHRKYNGQTWEAYSEPKLWDRYIAYELIVDNKTPQIPSRFEGYSKKAAKNATITTIKLYAGGDLIENGYTLTWNKNNLYTSDSNGNYWLNNGVEDGSCVVFKDQTFDITVTASIDGIEVASQTIYITRQDTDAYQLHINPGVRIYLGENDYAVDNYDVYVTKLDVDGNYSKDTNGEYLLVLDDINTEESAHSETCTKYDASNPLGQQTAINNFINNPEYISNDLMLYLYHWESRFDGKTDNWIKNHLGERLDVTQINTINASDVINNIDGNYQIALNYDTLNIPSSKINNQDWFENHKINAKVIHNGQINICNITAHIDLPGTAGQDAYIIDSHGQHTHEISSDNGTINVQIAEDLNQEAILTIEAEIHYNRDSEYGVYTLVKNVPINISEEAEVLNLFDNVGILYADNQGEYGIQQVDFTVYDEIAEQQYIGSDIQINVSCSDLVDVHGDLITTILLQNSSTKKWILYLDTEYRGETQTQTGIIKASQADFMSAVQSYLSNLQNGNKVSLIFSLVKNGVEKAKQVIEIDFTAFKLPEIDVDIKNDSITLPIGWHSSDYNSVANIDCVIHIDGKDISEHKHQHEHGEDDVFSYRIESNDNNVLIGNSYGHTEYYISDCQSLQLGKHIVPISIIVKRLSTNTEYTIVKQVSLNITNQDFYYLEFQTKALNTVVGSQTVTQNIYYDIYKYENGVSIKLSGQQNDLWIRHAESLQSEYTSASWSNPNWNSSLQMYQIQNMSIEYSVSDYIFILATQPTTGNFVVQDYVELPVIYYGKSDRRIYYLMQAVRGYEQPNMFITYNIAYEILNAIHNYFKSNGVYNEWINHVFAFRLTKTGSSSYNIEKFNNSSDYNIIALTDNNQYACLIAISNNAFGVSPQTPYEFYATSELIGADYQQFGNLILNSSIGQDGYGRRYIYLKTNKDFESVRKYYLTGELQTGIWQNISINNLSGFQNDEFYPNSSMHSGWIQGNDIWSDDIQEPSHDQRYVYEFSDKKVNNIWQNFDSFILRDHFDTVFQFNNDNTNIIIDDDSSDTSIIEVTKTRFSFFDGTQNNTLYINGISDNNIFVGTVINTSEYVIEVIDNSEMCTDLSYDSSKEFIRFKLNRTDGKILVSKYQITYAIYKYVSEGNHHGDFLAISNQNLVIKNFSSGETYKITTSLTQIQVRTIKTGFELEDQYKDGGAKEYINLYFQAYDGNGPRSLIQNNVLDENFFFKINGQQQGQNLFDSCTYIENVEYNVKHITGITFKTSTYTFQNDATSHDTAKTCGYMMIDGQKKDIKYYRNDSVPFLYCKYDNSEDESYYFYVFLYDAQNHKTDWVSVDDENHSPGSSFQRSIVFSGVTSIGNCFISDGMALPEDDHFKLKVTDIFNSNAEATQIDLLYQGGDFSLNPVIVDSQTISYVKSGLPGNDVLPMVRYTIEPQDLVFLVNDEGKYQNNNLALDYYITAEYGTSSATITTYSISSASIGNDSIPNNKLTISFADNKLTFGILDYNELALKKNIRINCNVGCEYTYITVVDGQNIQHTGSYTRTVSFYATPVVSGSSNITYEFIPNVTSIGQSWSYGSSYYFPNILSGTLDMLVGNSRYPLTLNGSGNIIYNSNNIGTYSWKAIGKNGSILASVTDSTIELSHALDYYSIRFCYSIGTTNYVYDIPVNKGAQQQYSISVKSTADGVNQDADQSEIKQYEGNIVIDNNYTSGNNSGLYLVVYDTSQSLIKYGIPKLYYLSSELGTLNSDLNNLKDSKYIICLASYKASQLNSDLIQTLKQFGLGDLKHVGTVAARAPFAFIGQYGLAEGNAYYREVQPQSTKSNIEISAKVIGGTLDFVQDGKDGSNGQNGYPGCITRMFKTNVVAEKTYYNQTKSNPNDQTKVPDGVCKLDYMVVFDGTAYYAFVVKYTHTVTTPNDSFLNDQKQISNYVFDKNNVYVRTIIISMLVLEVVEDYLMVMLFYGLEVNILKALQLLVTL